MLQFPDMIKKATGLMERMEQSMGGLFKMAKQMLAGQGAAGSNPFAQLTQMQAVVQRVSE